jgi:hypothetical protein
MTYVSAAAAAQKRIPLSNGQRQEWNSFLNYLKQKGVQGSTALDDRDTGLGQKLMEEYRTQNPHFSLTYDQVPQVQQDLQNYRQQLIQKWKANPKTAPDVKDESEIMGGISPVDGWLGSKTSSYRYPVATLNTSDGNKVSYGTDVNSYDAAIANIKK